MKPISIVKLILIRHGESMWNKINVFTGWVDIPLSSNGIEEAIKAGEQLASIYFDVVFTSVQIRAIESTMIILGKNKSDKTPVIMHNKGKMKDWSIIYSEAMTDKIIPICCDWHLNERYYGELQGKNKAATAIEFGVEQVQLWRRSYDIPPPKGESLKDTAKRTIPYFNKYILTQLLAGKTVLVSAHGNSLRSIIMFIENISTDEITSLEIPTGKPFYYEFKNGMLEKKSNSPIAFDLI